MNAEMQKKTRALRAGERGFHAYALPADDYEIARCHDAPPTAPPRPRRLHAAEAERLDAAADGAQLDVIFSRVDAEWLQNYVI